MTERVRWVQAQELIEKHAGPVTSARPVSDGFNSEIAVVVNETAFVKGLRTDHPRVWTQQRERHINPHVRHVSAPLQWSEVADGWDLNGFEYLKGRPADYGQGSPDLGPIAAMIAQFPEAPADVELKRAEQRWSAYSDRGELFAGGWLSHTDWSPSNVLLTGGKARMVDWAWPTIGADWIDPACWVVWLIAHGHSPQEAEAWAAKVPAFSRAPDVALAAFAQAQAAMWEDIGEQAPHSGLAPASANWSAYRSS